MRARRSTLLAVAFVCVIGFGAARPATASAFNLIKPICTIGGWFSGLFGKACGVVQTGGKLLGIGKKVESGVVAVGGRSKVAAVVGLVALGAWVAGGARAALDGIGKLISHSTSPQLSSTWFSATYWRVAEVSFVLTLPFLFAAAVQALLRSDLSLLARSALGYLPLAMLAIGLAAPLTMVLLSASDAISGIVSSAAGGDGARFVVRAGAILGGLGSFAHAPFLVFLVALVAAAGALALWIELVMREAAVYVVVLMLPLAFASLVWPNRRVWAVRAVELLVALILSKFAIVAVLTLAASALGHSLYTGVTAGITGVVLVMMAALAPWALMRLVPLAELAGGAVGSLRPNRDLGPAEDAASRIARALEGRRGEADQEATDQPDGGASQTARTAQERLGDQPRVSATGDALATFASDRAPASGSAAAPSPSPAPQSGSDSPDAPTPADSTRGADFAPIVQMDDAARRPFVIDQWPPEPIQGAEPDAPEPPPDLLPPAPEPSGPDADER